MDFPPEKPSVPRAYCPGCEPHADVPHPEQPGESGPDEGPGDFVLVRGDCLRLRLWGPCRLRCLSPDPARYALVTVAP